MNTNARNVDEYIQEQKSHLQKNPECANTLYNLGMGYLTKRMFKEAEEAFLKSVECSSKMAEAYVQLGGIAMQRGDMDGCLRYNMLAHEAQPFFAVPHANMGFVLMQKGDLDKAHKHFKKAIQIDPKFVQAHGNMGNCLYMMGQTEDAEKSLLKAVEIEPNFGPAWNTLALVALDAKDFAKAAEYADKAAASGYQVAPEIIDEIKAGQT
jgi:tetratricopeptide (TPR) repeat protein